MVDTLPGDVDDELSEVGRHCPKCGRGAVTTYCPPMLCDEQVYSVFVLASPRPTVAAIRAVDGFLYCIGPVAARSLLQQGDVEVAQEKAKQIRQTARRLEAAGVPFRIAPDFPWGW
jgi:hypothetical protein